MSAKTPPVFTREFKIDLCRQIQSGQKRPAQVCREHQLTEAVLLRWRREFEQPFWASGRSPGSSTCASSSCTGSSTDVPGAAFMSVRNLAGLVNVTGRSAARQGCLSRTGGRDLDCGVHFNRSPPGASYGSGGQT